MAAPVFAQQMVEGEVMTNDDKGKMIPLPGANVYWEGEYSGVISDDEGHFSIEQKTTSQRYLVVSYVGFSADTFDVQTTKHIHVMLSPDTELKTVVVEGAQSSKTINTVDPIGTEQLNKKELLKAACCNLSESFETNNTVDAEFSDAVTGAKTIKLLGLDGVYAQIMTENMDNVRGLSSAYGLTFIPGPWIESIQITKGPGSVVNGYEGITGSINTEYKKPFDADEETARLDVYGNQFGRWEANAVYKHPFNLKWSTGLYGNVSQMQQKVDHNDDGFLDVPMNSTYTFMNKWNYFSGGMHEAQFGVKYINSNVTGGQTSFDVNSPRTTENGYGVGADISRWELFMKNGFVFKRPSTSIGTILQFADHNQTGFYGLNNYAGAEQFIKAEAIFVTYIGNTNSTIKTGLNYLYDNFDESFDSISYLRNESVPGIFAEYHYQFEKKWSVLAGLRVDQHNLYGTFVTPRMHVKFTPKENTTLRASAGKGYHIANVLIENSSILTSNRTLIIQEPLEPEEGWNYGISLIQQFKLNHREGTFTLDVYRTDFINQVVIDMDANVNEINVYNLKGEAYTNVLQAEINYEPIKRLELRAAYKYVDSKATYDGKLLEVPLTFKDRGLFNVAYNWKKAGLSADATAQFYGKTRLPDLSENHAAHDFGTNSEPYIQLLAQVTKSFGDLDVYVGSENITGYTQHNPIIDATDPFGENFDAGVIYAPLMPRMFYGGLRYIFN
ncbi:MAG TPA: TonB-dependent receptor [Chitinophagales bacterium]|nr:TonB-dependent receptor [Chitinophagales bacterium]HNK99094.1 TonB-dependent receptor [Chitinophagales bacterium]